MKAAELEFNFSKALYSMIPVFIGSEYNVLFPVVWEQSFKVELLSDAFGKGSLVDR